MESAAAFDFRLYSDVTAKIELDAEVYTTIGEAYKAVNGKECNAVGAELSYEQATSMTMFLVDTYGIHKVLDAYFSQDVVGTFGKAYEDLTSDWLAYLKS